MSEVTETRAPETRTIDVDVQNIDTRGRTLVGYAAVYGAESRDLGGFTETIRPAAFAGVMDADVRALLNHDPSQVLGRTRSGTLRLTDETRGLRFEVDLPTSPLGDNVREAVKRGDIDGASFRFVVGEEEWEGDKRTIVTVKELQDVTVATYGAYPDASVELRTRPESPTTSEEDTMEVEDRTEGGGGLAVEDRAQTAETATVEERIANGLRSVRKGENRALTTAASVSPGELSTVLFDRLRASSVVLATGIKTLTTTADSVTYPTLTADVSPAWTAEAAAINPGDPTFATLTAALDNLSRREHFTDPDDRVFINHVGDVLGQDLLRRRFKKALVRAGLQPMRLHDLRHTFGTLAVQAFPLSDVKAYMGHAQIETTMLYVHHVPQHDAADKLSALVTTAQDVHPTVHRTGDIGAQLSATEGNGKPALEPNRTETGHS